MLIKKMDVLNMAAIEKYHPLAQSDDCRWWAWTHRCAYDPNTYYKYVDFVDTLMA